MVQGIDTITYIQLQVEEWTSTTLRGVNFTKRTEDWLLIVKVTGSTGMPLVGFIAGDTPAHCVELLETSIRLKTYKYKWKQDKYAGS